MKLTTKKLKELIKEELNEMAISDEEMMQRMQRMDSSSDDIDVSMSADLGDEDMYALDLLDQSIDFLTKTEGDGQELSPEMAEKVYELMKKAQEVLGYA
jgi:hypothetical protein